MPSRAQRSASQYQVNMHSTATTRSSRRRALFKTRFRKRAAHLPLEARPKTHHPAERFSLEEVGALRRRAPQRSYAAGPDGKSVSSRPRRSIVALRDSLQRVWENVLDWEHLGALRVPASRSNDSAGGLRSNPRQARTLTNAAH